jgi:TRAP-type C4-dicarboxylate transport system substrate-binding protein
MTRQRQPHIKLISHLLSAVGTMAVLLAAPQADAKMVLKAGHVVSANTDQGRAAVFFAKRVAELTNGEIEIQVFHDGQLGTSDPEQLESVMSGAQGFFFTGMEWFKAWDDRFGILSTPFVFRDRAHLRAFLESDLFADMQKSLEENGLKFVPRKFTWIRAADRGIFASRPIFTPDDARGIKLRMFQSEMPIKTWTALGANLLVMPWADVYTAFATGQVEAVTGSFFVMLQAKHVEHAKYFTNLKEYFQPISPVIGMATWEKLTDDQKRAMEQAAEEAGETFVQAGLELTVSSMEEAKRKYGVSFIDVPLQPWHDKMAPVLVDFEDSGVLPKGLVEQVKAIK